jgi:hypothetical protein
VRALIEVTVWRLSRGDFDLVLGRYLGLGDTITNMSHQRLEANRVLSTYHEHSEAKRARSA